MPPEVLLISALPETPQFAEALTGQLGVAVELAPTQRQALTALRRDSFSVVVIEQSLAERDADWAESVWQHSGLAVPIELNFSISARPRLLREIKAALTRRNREMALARSEAAAQIGNELKGSITGLLLQTQLTLQEPSLPPALAPKLRHLVDLASGIRERLRQGL
ncbi:hypothetical protein SAMN05421771_1958 [Granulicella pectinivorans]|uniref:Response regulatory domain-containing protein n=1 Tax=Granulicella pectinivorans TaxID=474950 RepID=A0A1I6M6S0_9BACT|nr:hypothetical protein [Granulicella pectinivorans]SFS11396.1 hypothetical protein SAMN05421771_1958 [Granulicella pectinivorans]